MQIYLYIQKALPVYFSPINEVFFDSKLIWHESKQLSVSEVKEAELFPYDL